MNTPSVAIIVLCWNGVEDTLECLSSLRKVEYAQRRVVVVDNGSTDSTATRVRGEFPEVELLQTGKNLGFAGGNNVGIARALRAGADAVMLLNNDTVVDPRFLAPLVAALFESRWTGAVNPAIYYYGERQVIWSAGGELDWNTGVARQKRIGEVDLGHIQHREEVDYGVGAALLMKREAIEATGLLDEHFYLYYEETDWCARARDAGYTTIFVPESKVWHKVSRSMDGGTPQQVYYLSRNRLMFLSKRGMRPLAAVRRLCEFGRMAASMAFRGRPRESWAVCRGVFDFWWRHRGRA